jgi:hypothetical protein
MKKNKKSKKVEIDEIPLGEKLEILRKGLDIDIEDLQKQISLNLIELNKQYQSRFGEDRIITRNYWRKFTNLYKEDDLILLGWANFSDFKKDVLGEARPKINRKNLQIVGDDSDIEKERWYFVTSLSAGDSVNWDFKSALDTFCKEKNAKLIIMAMRGCISSDEEYEEENYNKLAPYLYTHYIINNNLHIIDDMSNPQQFIPLTSMDRLRHSNQILAHPKFEFKSLSVEKNKYPHILHTTGSIGNGNTYRPVRAGYISAEDHCLGGIIIHVIDSERFHIRQVLFDKVSNSITDLGIKYSSNGKISKNYPKAIYLGDYHTDCTDPQAREATIRMINKLNIPVALSGDVFSGRSISHYEKNNMKAILDRPENVSTLEKELDLMGEELNYLLSNCKNLNFKVIKGNHDIWLDNYLKFSTYANDPNNIKLAVKLASVLFDGQNPAEYYIKNKFPKIADRLEFFKESTSYKISGIELGQHGHQNQEGLRVSRRGIQNESIILIMVL